MTPRKILVLNGHPGERSLSQLFANTYAASATAAGHDVQTIDLADLDFDPDFGGGGYHDHKPLEPDLEDFTAKLQWADHFVLALPMWWGSMPAKLKGLFDRTFLPGVTFDTRNKTKLGLPAPLLTGRTAQLIVTADTPMWALRMLYSRAMLHMMHGQILKFVGMKPRKPLWFAGATDAKSNQIDKWIAAVKSAATAAA